MADPSSVFVDEPYVLGSDRSTPFAVETEDENGVLQPADFTGDRIEIHVSRRFADADETDVLRFASPGPAIVLGTEGEFTWTLTFRDQFPIGALQYRCWWIKSPDTAQETREVLWTATMIVTR